jgi:GT2 family glycosyltransferase
MDADDLAEPFRLARQVEYLDGNPKIDVLGSQIAVVDARGAMIGHRRFPERHEDVARALPRIVPLSQPSVMMRRSVFETFGGYRFTDYPAGEDYEYWSRLIQRGVRFANHPDVLLSYRLHAGQTKFCKLHQTILANLRVKELYWADQMDFRAQVWRQSEKLLLHLPKWLVVWLLKSLYYHVRHAKSKGEPVNGNRALRSPGVWPV